MATLRTLAALGLALVASAVLASASLGQKVTCSDRRAVSPLRYGEQPTPDLTRLGNANACGIVLRCVRQIGEQASTVMPASGISREGSATRSGDALRRWSSIRWPSRVESPARART